ncbi:MAG: four-helix bundle copper-binding protein [Methylotenera sp.]|uniref:four-helix bundle copper-binding protein n=1 Tax=Methylotenera sp. TaxID=2051956 RepID=UPI0017FCBC20|nr:four-helix bundle copper-binding protein [Methylotenera sp.]NOU24707.1 four-helix bundle copper-binding protein [Methylotenera sp.]
MNRRELLLGSVALAGTAFANRVQSAEMNHEHHHHEMSLNAALVTAAADCVQKGQVCLNHCLFLLGNGDKAMADCAKSVNEILALCGALQGLANQESTYLPKLAKVAMDACKKCEDECKKHEDKHEACKACGESCAACYKECKKIAV